MSGIFFATSHGKNACDGIGGTVKRLVTKASLQRTSSRHITNVHQFHQFCTENIKNIECIYIPESDIVQMEQKLQERFSHAITVKGTLGFHKMVPQNKHQVKAYVTSDSSDFKLCNVSGANKISNDSDITCKIGDYIACIYENKCWLGIVAQESQALGDSRINFMHPECHKSDKYNFPSKIDECWVLNSNILCIMQTPIIVPGTSIYYSFGRKDLTKVKQLYKKYK